MTPEASAGSVATPTTAAVTDAALNVRVWLAAVLRQIPSGDDMGTRALCHILVASWIADSIAGAEHRQSDWLPQVADHVAWSLNSSAHDIPDSVKPTLALLVEVLLSAQGHKVGPFRQFFADSVSVLRRTDPALDANRSLTDKRTLLHHAGVLRRPNPLPADNLLLLLDGFRLSASASTVESLTLELECLTAWGTRSVADLPVPRGVGDIIAGLAVDRLRHYDLPAAARLLRILESLWESGVVDRREDLYGSLLTHRRNDGRFGWYGPEAAKLAQTGFHGSGGGNLLATVELYLPTTLECLWTLAEISLDRWRLLAQVPPYGPE